MHSFHPPVSLPSSAASVASATTASVAPQPPTGPGTPRGCTCARLRRLTRRLTALYDHELATVGLRVTQFSLLATLQHAAPADDGLPVAELAARLDLDRTTLTRNLKPLVEQGWVRIRADGDDRRVRRVVLTDTGAQVLVHARPAWKRAQRTVNETLGGGDVAALHDWLDAVTPLFPLAGEDA